MREVAVQMTPRPSTQEVLAPMPNQYTMLIPAPIRFWTKVEFTDTCWLWTGYQNRGGYGAFRAESRGRKQVVTSRYAYEFCVGAIPEGLEIDHLCRVPACVNPDHLEPVTPRINQRRGMSVSGVNSRKTHCIRGHEFNEENTYYRPDNGTRQCRRCPYERRKAAYLERSR